VFLWIRYKTKQAEKFMQDVSHRNKPVRLSEKEKQKKRAALLKKLKP